MRVLSTKVHGILDYTVSALMIAAPWLFGFVVHTESIQNAGYGMQTWIFVILGFATLLYSMLTNYELGAFRNISMKTHLTLDILSGVFLALSPWLLGFKDVVFLPHVIFGVFTIIVVILTNAKPFHGRVPSSLAHG